MEDWVVHKPVLLKEMMEYLDIRSDGVYVDCTLGDGGYSLEMLKKIKSGTLYSLDVDQEAIDFVKGKFRKHLGPRWKIIKGNFSDITSIIKNISIDGIVFDLGMSSRQIEVENRGFSYINDQELDMRMDKDLKVTADDLLKGLSASELELLFRKYGEERYAKRISREIKEWVKENADKNMKTDDLVDLIRRVVPAGYRDGSKNPARRVFQSLRIAVNDEINSLRAGLPSALSILRGGGRMVVVSYHSLEDRVVKYVFREASLTKGYKVLTEKPVVPTSEELKINRRARSAKLRAIEKI